MFERRLKILLWIIALATSGLAARAAWIQVVQKDLWTQEAAKVLTQEKFIDTTRGRILDARGLELAVDEPCIDACVEYPAITEDWSVYRVWLHDQALLLAQRQYGQGYSKASRADREKMLAPQMEIVRDRVQAMWTRLAEVSGQTSDQIAEVRRGIIDAVETTRQHVMLRNYDQAVKHEKAGVAAKRPWLLRWLPSDEAVPRLDDYLSDVAGQSEAHVVLLGIDKSVYNELAKNAESMPGLVLRPGHRRVYPFGSAACHIVGHLAKVGPAQLKDDADESDPLRKYQPTELAGQTGVEAMCEAILRGSRGEDRDVNAEEQTTDPVPGKDVRLTIDIHLQQAIENAFVKERQWIDPTSNRTITRENQPGAAVVIDLAENKVRALVSCPVFDPNTLDADYARLSRDDVHSPLVDRATSASYEPGSIVKPMMGLAAMADGIITPRTTIECNGYLVLDGHQYSEGRCWTVSEFGYLIGGPDDPRHHHIPTQDPHPTGFLTVSDAIERSCNVFFETVADKMKMPRQRYWYDRFGLGRPTGIGLAENSGFIPNPAKYSPLVVREQTWFAGIGQGSVSATPLQMANVAATIARDGSWMRPKLVDDPAATGGMGNRVDLGFSTEAVRAVKEGMEAVVNKRAGTGNLHFDDAPGGLESIVIAGKTGTPQVGPLKIPVRDDQGRIVMENGRAKLVAVNPADPSVNTWYIGGGKEGTDYAHAWFIGYAPAAHPKIAFAVFVEYGGSGGPVAGSITADLLEACYTQGYLK